MTHITENIANVTFVSVAKQSEFVSMVTHQYNKLSRTSFATYFLFVQFGQLSGSCVYVHVYSYVCIHTEDYHKKILNNCLGHTIFFLIQRNCLILQGYYSDVIKSKKIKLSYLFLLEFLLRKGKDSYFLSLQIFKINLKYWFI